MYFIFSKLCKKVSKIIVVFGGVVTKSLLSRYSTPVGVALLQLPETFVLNIHELVN